jgi:hypothetical protein
MLLSSFHSTKNPYEVNGTVRFTLDGQEHVFFAPSIVAIPEPTTFLLMSMGMLLLTTRAFNRRS